MERFENKLQLQKKIKLETLNKYWIQFLNEYEMTSFTVNNSEVIQINISSNELNKLKKITEKICSNSISLKQEYTMSGKVAEYAFSVACNSLFHFFKLKKKIHINEESYIYGGDGGGDFFVGNKIIDIKYRDEAPNRGLYLDKSFIEKANPNNVIVHTTNSTSMKVGNLFSFDGQAMPIALVGWTTIKDFEKNADKRNDRWLMDKGFSPIKSLLLDILKNQQAFEECCSLKEIESNV